MNLFIRLVEYLYHRAHGFLQSVSSRQLWISYLPCKTYSWMLVVSTLLYFFDHTEPALVFCGRGSSKFQGKQILGYWLLQQENKNLNKVNLRKGKAGRCKCKDIKGRYFEEEGTFSWQLTSNKRSQNAAEYHARNDEQEKLTNFNYKPRETFFQEGCNSIFRQR